MIMRRIGDIGKNRANIFLFYIVLALTNYSELYNQTSNFNLVCFNMMHFESGVRIK